MTDTTACQGRVARFRELMDARGYDAAIIRNNSDLRWLTGAERTFDDECAHTALVTPDGLWLHTDSRYFGTFLDRLGEGTAWKVDMERLHGAAWAAERIRQTRSRVVAVEDTLDLAFFDRLQEECAKRSVACLTPRLHGDLMDLRMVKDDQELALLRRAQEITDDAFDHICAYIRPGQTELQIRAELESYMLSHGADALSFGSIIASGENGANPHALPGERVVGEGDLIVMDYGAGYRDYHADMTRTVCVGHASEEQKRVYDVVRAANEACEAAAKAGVIGADIHRLAQKVIADAGYGDYFNHGLGHGVGIDIHERPSFGLAFDAPVPAGSVVTVEPGIYLPGKFGIRLEDTGVVDEEGYHPFGRSTHDLVEVAL